MQQGQQQRGQLWADKYRPRTISEMCYPSQTQNLKQWLQQFDYTNPKLKRGALLSGPPGVGKTTSVHLAAKELQLDVIELNASDHRSRKTLREHVSDIIDNRIFGFQAANRGSSGNKFILLMDEVDGCDLGGVGEVIEMIKKTKTPIVCTCNDRWHQKLRSLINHVEDMRFKRPPCNIVANYVCDRILAREGVSLPKQLLQEVIQKEGSDIRSILGNLQMWTLQHKTMDASTLASCARGSNKNTAVGIFDAPEDFLLPQNPPKTFEQLQSAFYSADLTDLFIQENYIHFRPGQGDWMNSVADAAASISAADKIQRTVYMEQNWSLSNSYLLNCAVIPSALVRGRYESFLPPGPAAHFDKARPIKFPTWLGNNSTTTKNQRLLSVLAAETNNGATQLTGNKTDLVTDYIPTGLAPRTTAPLQERGKEGVADAIAFMDSYGMLRDDWDFVQDVSKYKKMTSRATRMRYEQIETATKSAFTREFNKSHTFDTVAKGSMKHSAPATVVAGDDEEEAAEEEEGATTAKKAPAKAPGKKAAAKAPGGKRGAKDPAAKQTGGKRGRAAAEVL